MSPRNLPALSPRAAAEGIIGNGSFTTDWTGFQFQANSTNAVINELRFASSKTIRQSTIILASFNAVVGLILAVGIFWDCYRAAKRADPQMRFRKSMYTIIGPMHMFPFILAIGIIVQGTITAVEQSKGMQGLLILGCLPISQVMLPTIFIVPYIQFFFGMETTVRAFRRRAFDSFGKWTVSVCVALVVVSLAVTYAVTRVVQPPNFCFASLFWFVQRYRIECFSLFTAIAGSLLLGSLITFVRLYQSSTGSVIERIAASRMVYYMCIGAITNSIVVPFFASLTIRNDMEVSQLRGNLSMAAMVATNLTGLTNGGLYVFLRACQSSNIGRKGYLEMLDREKQRQLSRKRQIRKSPMTETYTSQIEQPVSPPPRVYRAVSPGDGDAESLIAESQIGLAKTSSATASQQNYSPRKVVHVRKASYSVFPQQSQQTPALNPKPLSILPAATYTPPTLARGPSAEVNDEDIEAMEIDIMRRDISSLLPPPPPLIPGVFVPGHQRDSSMGSSATVQIGLRLSNVNDMPRAGPPSFLQERMPTPRPTSSVYPKSMIIPAGKAAAEETPVSPRSSVLIGSTVWLDPTKELPPAPLQPVKKDKGKGKERESRMLLSPMVYSPDGGPGNSVMIPSPSDKDPRLSPESATEKRPSEWI